MHYTIIINRLCFYKKNIYMIPMIYMTYDQVKEIMLREIKICMDYGNKLENNETISQEEMCYHENDSFAFEYFIIRPNIYYYDFPYEYYEDITQTEFNNLINNDNNDVELIVLFKDIVYSTNIEYVNNCFIKERNDWYDATLDFFNTLFHTTLLSFTR